MRSFMMLLATMVPLSITVVSRSFAEESPPQAAPDVDARLLERYSSAKDKLHAELTARIPDLKDEARVQALLGSDRLDPMLAPFVVLHEATPEGLASFAQQGREQEALVEALLSNTDLMKQMLVADGPTKPKRGVPQWGPAMKIYTDIQKASKRAQTGIFQRLALACALEHATPLWQSNTDARPGPEYVDPLERYMGYEKAYLAGELDPAFPTFDTFHLCMVVNEHEPEWTHAWGREMMRNYRPDHLFNSTGNGSYSRFVTSDIPNTSARQFHDDPKLHGYQNILMNHGICGRRAFFGRFILRSFGIPTVKRPSRAHGALARWSPDGWKVDLGPGWGSGTTNTPYHRDRAFLKSTQARQNPEAYLQVKRAQWIGDLMGEKRMYWGDGGKDTWYGVSLLTQDRIIKDIEEGKLPRVDHSAVMEADEPTLAEKVLARPVRKEAISYSNDGTIFIPAAAYDGIGGRAPNNLLTVRSFDGGEQIYLRRFGPFGGAVPILKGGNYKKGSNEARSAKRIRRAGLGEYADWGMRVAFTPKGDNPPPELKLDLGNGVSMDFIYVKPGRFMMGSDKTEETKFTCPEAPRHEVTLTKGYYLGKYEVTRAQYSGQMNVDQHDYPAGHISKDEAENFCRALSEYTGEDVRLPTEAEWEYAARAGTDTLWFFGDDPAPLGDYAWYEPNAGGKPHPVGRKKPNPWGFHDMYGNLWECVSDAYHRDYYANSPKKDPIGYQQPSEYTMDYTIRTSRAGRYALTAEVVTANYHQNVALRVNGSTDEQLITLPMTLGAWQATPETVVELKAGENQLKFLRRNPIQYAVAIRSFTLRPVR